MFEKYLRKPAVNSSFFLQTANKEINQEIFSPELLSPRNKGSRNHFENTIPKNSDMHALSRESFGNFSKEETRVDGVPASAIYVSRNPSLEQEEKPLI